MKPSRAPWLILVLAAGAAAGGWWWLDGELPASEGKDLQRAVEALERCLDGLDTRGAGPGRCAEPAAELGERLAGLERENRGDPRMELHRSDLAAGYGLLARGLRRLEQHDAAFQAYRKAAYWDPQVAQHHGILARYYSERGEHYLAVRHARLAAQLDPAQPAAHRIKGQVLEAAGDLFRARQALQQALVLALERHDQTLAHRLTEDLASLGQVRRVIDESHPETLSASPVELPAAGAEIPEDGEPPAEDEGGASGESPGPFSGS